jgi:UDP-N-acetylglucosamine:LPS N-acetylglucosamine transferase
MAPCKRNINTKNETQEAGAIELPTQETLEYMRNKAVTICMISSSGGHYEELNMLKELENKYRLFWVTEKTPFQSRADYYLCQTDTRDRMMPFKMIVNCIRTFDFWKKERPQVVITTGTLVALPACLMAKLLRKKVIFIESFSRVHDCTRAGKLLYKIADLFLYQWEPLGELYPEGVYGGSIF